jgi:predicted ATPase
MGYPEALDQVVQIIESKIDEGIYILDEPLASLISKSRTD